VPNPISALKMEQINLHHSKAASAALLTRLATGKTGVVLIQEPWIVGNNICGSSTPYSIYSTPWVRVNPGTAFLLKHTLTAPENMLAV